MKTTKKHLIEAMTGTINSLLNGEVNNELSLINLEKFKDDELYVLADSIKKLNNKLIKEKEAVSAISLGNSNEVINLNNTTSKSVLCLNKQVIPGNKTKEFDYLTNESYFNLFGQMEKAFALFEIVNDKKGKPANYIFLEVNDYFEQTTGLKYTDVIGKKVGEVFKGTSKLWMDTCNLIAKDGITRQIEYYSEEFKNYINVIAFRTTKGKLTTITTNVSKWKSIEKKLKLFANIMKSISEYVSITDMDNNIIFVNNAFLNAYGYEESELLGKPISIVRDTYGEEENKVFSKTILNGGWSGSLLNKKKNGINFYIRLSTSIVKDEENTPVAIVGVASDITEYKLIQDSLKSYVSLLNATINSTVDGIVSVNLEGKIVIYNEQFLKIWGLSSEVLNQSSNDLLLSIISGLLEKQNNFETRIKALSLKPAESSFDTIILKDGRAFEAFSQPQLIDGKPVGRVWSFHDITKYRKMNKELLEDQEKLSLAMELAKLANWEYDIANDLFILNDEFYELYGTSAEKEGSYFLPSDIYTRKFVHPDEINVVKNEIIKALEAKNADYRSRIEHKIIRGDGQVRKIIVRSAVIMDDNGQIVKIYGANQDVTESRRISEALLKSEAKYRKVFEFVNDVFYETDSDGIITEISPSIQGLSGYSHAELIGQYSKLLYVNPNEREKFIEEVVLKGYVADYELKMKHKDGNSFYVSVSSHVKRNENGNFAGVEGSLRDISERKKHEKEIREINKELIELNATKDKFFSIIAHDLKGPFQGLLGYSDLLLNEFSTLNDIEKLEFVSGINNLSKATFKLLENLLHWARLQTGKIVFNTDFFNLFEALNSQIYLMQEAAKKKDIQIKSTIDKKIFVIADLDMLQTVIRNLISNSIKFTNPDGEIIVTAEDLKNEVKICVEDNGVGMSNENVHKLFKIEESFSTKGTEKEEGTGLGLLLCKEMIDMHKGEIWAESRPGKGTKIFFTIPSAE
jgi:PAS domain S-box-containing protein